MLKPEVSYFPVNFMAKNEHCLYFIIIMYQSEINFGIY